MDSSSTTDTDSNNGASYQKRTDAGSRIAASRNYEISLHCVVALMALSNKVEGNQTYEEDNYGCFDDLGFKYAVDGVKGKILLLQAKHSAKAETIGKCMLYAKNGGSRDNFSLSKYFMAFLDAKRTALANGQEIKHALLFTNRGICEELKLQLTEVTTENLDYPLKDLFSFPTQSKQSFFKLTQNLLENCDLTAFNDKKRELVKQHEKLLRWCQEDGSGGLENLKEEFQKLFTLAVNQPDVEELKQIERDVFAGLQFSRNMSNDEKKQIRENFHERVKEWMDKTNTEVSTWTTNQTRKCLREAELEVCRLQVKGRRRVS